MSPLSRSRFRFSGHQSFPFRYGWFAKAAEQIGRDPRLFGREDALAQLGVGKNMVASIRYWCEAAGLMEFRRVRGRGLHAGLTPLGRLLFGTPRIAAEELPPPPR